MKTQLAIIQPTSFCNINCRYCYLPNRAIRKRISLKILSQIFKVLLSSPLVANAITIVWHAGEPLTIAPRFYKQAFQLIEQWNTRGVRVINSIQTNATLINQEWCNLFKEHSVQVGVSLDGPEHIHNANRIDKTGHGTFDDVMRGIKLLKANDIKFSVIAVVAKNTLDYPDEFWQFFMELRPTRLGLNAEETEGIHKNSSLHSNDDIERYKKFYKRLLALSKQTPQPIIIRETESLMNRIKYGSHLMRTQTNMPGTIFSFDADGNISTFSPELLTTTHPKYENFIFGNVFENSLEDIFKNQKFIEVNAEIQHGIHRCMQTCDFFMFCGGGFPSNKIYENGTFDSTETQACRLQIKAASEALVEHLENLYGIS